MAGSLFLCVHDRSTWDIAMPLNMETKWEQSRTSWMQIFEDRSERCFAKKRVNICKHPELVGGLNWAIPKIILVNWDSHSHKGFENKKQ